jgi:hypothetical protein
MCWITIEIEFHGLQMFVIVITSHSNKNLEIEVWYFRKQKKFTYETTIKKKAPIPRGFFSIEIRCLIVEPHHRVKCVVGRGGISNSLLQFYPLGYDHRSILR